MQKFKVNDFVQIIKTGEYGIINATYPGEKYSIDVWTQHRYLSPKEFVLVDQHEVPKHLWSRIQTRVKNID